MSPSQSGETGDVYEESTRRLTTSLMMFFTQSSSASLIANELRATLICLFSSLSIPTSLHQKMQNEGSIRCAVGVFFPFNHEWISLEMRTRKETASINSNLFGIYKIEFLETEENIKLFALCGDKFYFNLKSLKAQNIDLQEK